MKKIKKRLLPVSLLALLPLFLTACASQTSKNGSLKAPTSGPYYWIYEWIGLPLQHITVNIAHAIGGASGAGWAIVIITLVVRVILMPLMLSQQHKATLQQEKMHRLQPQMQLLQKAMKTPGMTPDQQMALSGLQREIYSKNNVSMIGGMGCLPLLIQMPIMIGIYQAVAYSNSLAKSTFFGISLSSKSMVLAIIATVFALIQSYVAMIGIPEEQKKTMQATMLMNPIMTFFFSMSFSGALALYWAVGNLVMVIQQLITTFIVQPRAKKRVSKELADSPIVEVVTQAKLDQILKPATEKKPASQPKSGDLRKRNQGKQKRK